MCQVDTPGREMGRELMCPRVARGIGHGVHFVGQQVLGREMWLAQRNEDGGHIADFTLAR